MHDPSTCHQKRFAVDEQCFSACLRKPCQCRFDFIERADRQWRQLQTKRRRYRLALGEEDRQIAWRKALRMIEKADAARCRHGPPQKLVCLVPPQIDGAPCHVAAGPREARDQPVPNRIGGGPENDGNTARRLLGNRRWPASLGHDDLDSRSDERSSLGAQPRGIPATVANLDNEVLALDIPALTHTLAKRRQAGRNAAVRRSDPKKTHTTKRAGRLRAHGRRAGHQDKESPYRDAETPPHSRTSSVRAHSGRSRTPELSIAYHSFPNDVSHAWPAIPRRHPWEVTASRSRRTTFTTTNGKRGPGHRYEER